MSESMKDKLESLLRAKGVMAGAEWRQRLEEQVQRAASGEFEIQNVVPGTVVGESPDTGFYLVRTDYDIDTLHGPVPLGAALQSLPEHIALSACDDELQSFDPTTAVYLDTETTGLSGGAGTVAFLVGAGYFVDGMFRLEQCFMRDYDDEEPMIAYLGELFRRFETVVTYNGKSFDIPLLRTRFIQNRTPFRLDSALQLDLVHVARRFFKLRIQQCNLTAVERNVLGIQRHGDVPSELIPQMWFDYLRTRDARAMDRVFYHHRMDILSLAALTGLLSRSLAEPDGTGFEYAEDRLSLVRIHFRQKRYDVVVPHALRLLQDDLEEHLRHECLRLIAFAHKRMNDWERMAETWDMLLRENPRDLEARLELAKFHEHRARDLAAAERVCLDAIEYLETRRFVGGNPLTTTPHIQEFRYRLERIRKKLGRGGQLPE